MGSHLADIGNQITYLIGSKGIYRFLSQVIPWRTNVIFAMFKNCISLHFSESDVSQPIYLTSYLRFHHLSYKPACLRETVF